MNLGSELALFCDIRKSNSLSCLDAGELAHINCLDILYDYFRNITSHKASIQIVVMWSARHVHQFSHTR